MVENRGPQLQAVCSTFVSLAFVSVLLRIYVRLRLVKAFGWDDWFMVLAMVRRANIQSMNSTDVRSFFT